MDLFKLIGSIFIKKDDAEKQIDSVSDNAKNMATSVGKSMETAGKKISDIGKKLAPLSVATGAILTASVKGASDFTDGMAKMSTLFDTTQTSVSDLSKEFLELSNKTGISATQLAEAGYQALSAGQSVDQVAGFVETASKLSKAGFTDTTTAVDVLTTALNAYGEKAGTAEEISNKLVRTQNLGKTTVDELASSMGKIIPTASAMNVNIDNLTSGYVSLTKQGIATAEATTYMNSMLNELGDSGTDLGGILKEKTGKSFQQLMDEGYSLADVLQITKDYADENGIAYNELWGSAEAGKAGLAILNGGVEEFNDTVDTMKDKTDDVGQALEKLNTPSAKISKSLNRVKNSGIQLGTSLLVALTPVIDKVASAIEKLTTWFNGLSPVIQNVIGAVLGILTALSPVLIVGGKIISLIGSVVSWIGKIQGSATILTSVLGVLSNPITIIIAVVTALIAIFARLYKTNDKFRAQVNTAWEAIKTKIGSVVEAVRGLIEAVVEKIRLVIAGFVIIATAIWDTFGTDIINIFSNTFNWIQTIVQTALDIVAGIIRVVTAIINGDWSTAWTEIQNLAQTIWTGIQNIVSAGVGIIGSIINLGLHVIQTVWKKVWDFIKTFITKLWNTIKKIVSNAINSVKTTITNILNNIKTTVTNKLNDIKQKFTDKWNDIKTTVTNKINDVKSKISGGLESAKSTVTDKLNSIKQKFTDKMNDAKEAVRKAIDKIKGFFDFSWSLPKLKMPHFSMTGKFSLFPPSVPKISIDWYKKAMEDPYLMTDPTIFGMNGSSLMAGGEAGNEMIYGHRQLMEDIRTASGRDELLEAFESWMNRFMRMFSTYFPKFESMQMVTDTGALVGEITPMIDKKLGKTFAQKGRGN